MTGRAVRLVLGMALILVGSAAIFSTVDERVLGTWTAIGGKFQIVPFMLIFGGLWLALGGRAKGTR